MLYFQLRLSYKSVNPWSLLTKVACDLGKNNCSPCLVPIALLARVSRCHGNESTIQPVVTWAELEKGRLVRAAQQESPPHSGTTRWVNLWRRTSTDLTGMRLSHPSLFWALTICLSDGIQMCIENGEPNSARSTTLRRPIGCSVMTMQMSKRREKTCIWLYYQVA